MSNYASSENYQPPENSIEARSEAGVRYVLDQSRLGDHEKIDIQGMELTVGQARDLGLLGRPIDDGGLSIGNAAVAAQSEPEPVPTTGHAEFDATAAQLQSQVEAGQITETEAMTYENVVAEIAMADLTPAQISETIDGIADGTVDPMDLTQNQRDIIRNTETQVTQAATQSAMAELGKEQFDKLQQIAKVSPEVNAAIRTYAGMRSLGVADVSWTEFMQDVQDHVAGR